MCRELLPRGCAGGCARSRHRNLRRQSRRLVEGERLPENARNCTRTAYSREATRPLNGDHCRIAPTLGRQRSDDVGTAIGSGGRSRVDIGNAL